MRTQIARSLIINILLFLSLTLSGIAQGFLSDGEVLQFAIPKSAVYKITYQDLINYGINSDGINPKNISVFTSSGGMLPQENSSQSDFTTTESAVRIVGEEDGSFDPGDFILFYAEGPDEIFYDLQTEQIFLEKNLYDTVNYVFLKIGDQSGKRMTDFQAPPGNGAEITFFDDFIHHETEERNLLNSGRYWLGEKLSVDNAETEDTKTLTFTYDDISLDLDSEIKVYSKVINTTSREIDIDYSINSLKIGTMKLPRVSPVAYGVKGKEEFIYQHRSVADLPQTDKIELKMFMLNPGTGGIFLDFHTINFRRPLQLTGNQTVFRSFEALTGSDEVYKIDAPSDAEVWNVTHALEPVRLIIQYSNQSVLFTYDSDIPETFVVFDRNSLAAPQFLRKIENQDIRNSPTPELLIITVEVFKGAANRLASFRQSNDGLSAKVVSVNEIYREFSSGRQDISAIRNYIKELYDQGGLSYVLLFGDASYDYKNIQSASNTNFVPTYESRNYLHNIHSYASDDYFTFMEFQEGAWPEKGFQLSDHTMDIGIGRLPVTSVAEADEMVDKLIHYSQHKKTYGEWRTKLAFFADDGDDNIHQYQSDYLASYVEDTFPSFNSNRVFIDAYPKESEGSRNYSPEVKSRLDQSVKEGRLIIDFIGHGAETAWTNEYILSTDMFEEWNNLDNLPLFVTATCEFGRYDDWRRQSGAEQLVLRKEGGAIAMLTTTRPVFFSTNFEISEAFYRYAFKKIDNQWPRLGDIFRLTKNDAIEGVINRNFSLIGDPSMRLNYPEREIKINWLRGEKIVQTDSMKLAEVLINGSIYKDDGHDNAFNGLLELKLFNEKTKVTTLGASGPDTKMSYFNRNDVLLKGKAKIIDGEFQLSMFIPQAFIDSAGLGKLSFYAYDSIRMVDASGAIYDFDVDHQTDTTDHLDSIPPQISFWDGAFQLENNENVFGVKDITVKLYDESGINLLANDESKKLKGWIEGRMNLELDLLSLYEPDVDTYKSGSVSISIADLAPGNYMLTVNASDLLGNTRTEKFSFRIIDQLEVNNYPNPATDLVNFQFKLPVHNQTYIIKLKIYSLQGVLLEEYKLATQYPVSEEYVQLEFFRHQVPSKFPAGVYIYNIEVDSDHYQNSYKGKVLFVD